jgi:molybdopterin synthase catalytic subunit|tara:strand:- start:447 stop:878 length:432 start_codon:yes stop_codon:yes gene_type:complete
MLLTKNIISIESDLLKYEKSKPHLLNSGAKSFFVGSLKEKSYFSDKKLIKMHLDIYPNMTELYLKKIKDIYKNKFELNDLFILHRYGDVKLGDILVLICAWSDTRKKAINGVEAALEDIKYNAPFWKKEYFEDGSCLWVEKNT